MTIFFGIKETFYVVCLGFWIWACSRALSLAYSAELCPFISFTAYVCIHNP